LLKELHPDILLLDLVMPVADGMEFLRLMGNDSDTVKPGNVVLMTAMTNPVPAGSMKALGLDLILEKPFRLHQLADAVGADSPFESP
jgi:CheY-like chemotaxis protein